MIYCRKQCEIRGYYQHGFTYKLVRIRNRLAAINQHSVQPGSYIATLLK